MAKCIEAQLVVDVSADMLLYKLQDFYVCACNAQIKLHMSKFPANSFVNYCKGFAVHGHACCIIYANLIFV